MIANELVAWFKSQVGVHEVGGNNMGPQVEEYQRTVDGRASREPWCLGFVQTGVMKVCLKYHVKNPLFPTEHVQTLYRKTPQKYKVLMPKPGRVFIMGSKTSDSGHTGVTTNSITPTFRTIEGNTNEAGSREGNVVAEKMRHLTGNDTMNMLGFIDVPQMIWEQLPSDIKA